MAPSDPRSASPSGACARNSPANTMTTLRNDAEDRSNPAATPYYGFTTDPNSSSLLERGSKTETPRESRGQRTPALSSPLKTSLPVDTRWLRVSQDHISRSLLPLYDSGRLVNFDLTDRREEPETRVATTERFGTVSRRRATRAEPSLSFSSCLLPTSFRPAALL